MRKEGRKLVDDLTLLLELYQDMYANVCNTYDILINFSDNELQYPLAASYLSLAHNSYTHAHIYISTHDLRDSDFEKILVAYKNVKVSFDELMVHRNMNVYRLSNRYNEFKNAYLLSKRSLESLLEVRVPQ